ncbi:MAG: sulfatase-like hydrolase/transferase, partial [Deltaproteobacteria bacterium]|nr:sulfatase-like hydrolase/transferase [Deltaproteobacteria bacterium]
MRIRVMLAIILVVIFSVSVEAAESKPNIVLIFMDNFGYGELGVYGGGITRGAPTPRIDTLAEEGIRLTN